MMIIVVMGQLVTVMIMSNKTSDITLNVSNQIEIIK